MRFAKNMSRTCYPVLALIVGRRDGLYDAESSLSSLPLVFLVVEEVRVLLLLLPQEVVLLIGIKVPGGQEEIFFVILCLPFCTFSP